VRVGVWGTGGKVLDVPYLEVAHWPAGECLSKDIHHL
jgi:hypothetical protein